MINKLTGEPVSEEMQSVLKRLAANESVPEAEIMALKEIKEANSCISSSKPTIELKNRAGIQKGVFDRLQNMGSAVTRSDGAVSFSGEILCERRLDIVIGLPASGKSSALVEPISEMYKSRVIDSDEAKKLLPEYNDGWGAGVVHKESQRISEQQLLTALEKGENITYPRVGGDTTELMYADIFGTIPIAEALLGKGALLGVVLSFMMAVTTLSLPSMIMLRKAVKPKLLGIFIAICTIECFYGIEIPLPDYSSQLAIVNIYKAYTNRRKINEQLKEQIKNICSILIKGSLVEGK